MPALLAASSPSIQSSWVSWVSVEWQQVQNVNVLGAVNPAAAQSLGAKQEFPTCPVRDLNVKAIITAEHHVLCIFVRNSTELFLLSLGPPLC